jgi:hypothetical protein
MVGSPAATMAAVNVLSMDTLCSSNAGRAENRSTPMNSLPDLPLSPSPRRVRRAAKPALALVCTFAAAAIGWHAVAVRADEPAAAASPPSPGIWQSHKFSFQYMGFTSTYSCDGLADKLRVLLLAAGARSDV